MNNSKCLNYEEDCERFDCGECKRRDFEDEGTLNHTINDLDGNKPLDSAF